MNKNCLFSFPQMSHMPNFLPSLLLRRPIHSLSIPHQPQPLTVLLRLPYPIQYYTITIQSSIFPKEKKQNEVESSTQPSPLSSPPEMPKRKTQKTKKIPEPWINYLLIKLFNSNNLIQTFPFLSFLSILSFSIPFFLSFPHTKYTIYLKR